MHWQCIAVHGCVLLTRQHYYCLSDHLSVYWVFIIFVRKRGPLYACCCQQPSESRKMACFVEVDTANATAAGVRDPLVFSCGTSRRQRERVKK